MKRVLCLCVLLGATLVAGIPGQGQDEVRLAVSPGVVYLQGEQDAHSGFCVVTNYASSDTIDIVITIEDFALSPEGAYQPLPPGTREEYSLAPYITFEPSEATLGPGESLKVNYTIALPAGENAGPYWGALVVSPKERVKLSQENEDGTTPMLGIEMRFVYPHSILIYAREEIAPLVSILGCDVACSEQAGAMVATANLILGNLCEDVVTLTYSLMVRNGNGQTVREFSSPRPRAILPLETRQFDTSLSMAGLPSGTYTLEAMVDFGGDEPLITERVFEL